MITISNIQEERAVVEYINTRNEVRAQLAGVYVSCKQTLLAYQSLESRLEIAHDTVPQGDLSAYAAYHATSVAPVANYISTLKAAMSGIIDIMEGIERAVPETFGISIPIV